MIGVGLLWIRPTQGKPVVYKKVVKGGSLSWTFPKEHHAQMPGALKSHPWMGVWADFGRDVPWEMFVSNQLKTVSP